MKRVNCYAAIREMREQIVKTMQERGIKELPMFMSYEDWCKDTDTEPEENEDEDFDYMDYKDDVAPFAIFFDKHGCGYDYRVDKVTLKTYGTGYPVLEFDCHENELGDDTFGEDDFVFLTLYNVYDTMLDLLEIKDEPSPIWVLFAESLYDYEIVRRVINVFENEDDARKAFTEEVKEARKCATTNEWTIGNDNENFFEAYPDGSWGTSHETVELNKTLINEKITCRN